MDDTFYLREKIYMLCVDFQQSIYIHNIPKFYVFPSSCFYFLYVIYIGYKYLHKIRYKSIYSGIHTVNSNTADIEKSTPIMTSWQCYFPIHHCTKQNQDPNPSAGNFRSVETYPDKPDTSPCSNQRSNGPNKDDETRVDNSEAA